MPKFVSNSNSHAMSGEWDFENHTPGHDVSKVIIPNGATLPTILEYQTGQLFFVTGSGILAMSVSGVWYTATGTSSP